MKHLKKFNEEFEWNKLNPFKRTQPVTQDSNDMILHLAEMEINKIIAKNESFPEFLDIKNKIDNLEFNRVVKDKPKGYRESGLYRVKMEDNKIIQLYKDSSCGVGEDGADINGAYIEVYKLLVNDVPIGQDGYISYKSYEDFTNKFEDFNRF